MRLPVLIATALGGALTGGSVAAPPGDPLQTDMPAFIPMEEITAPIVDGGRLDGAVKLRATIESASLEKADVLRPQLPQLRAEMFASMLEFSRLYASGLRAVDAEKLGAQLSDSLRRQHPEVRRVLILKLSAQPA